MAKRPAPEERIIKATLALAAARGWRDLSLGDVAAKAKVPLAEVLIPFPTKYAIVNAFQDRIDAEMLTAAGGGEGDDTRDRLFDLLMERFDALRPHRAALAEIVKDSLCDPGALAFLPRMARSMARVLEAAGVSAAGPLGVLKAKGLALVYAGAFRVWLKDESEDLGPTMAALDKGLRRAERAASFLAGTRGRPVPPT